jgi:hypothetical protein
MWQEFFKAAWNRRKKNGKKKKKKKNICPPPDEAIQKVSSRHESFFGRKT